MRPMSLVRGAGGGGGGGGSELDDTLRGTQTADVLDLISEGECEGLVNGLKSIYFDGVPLQAADGSFNFKGWDVATTPGTQGQASIAGTDGVQNEIGVGVDVLAATPIVRTITNAAIDTCRVTILVPQLSKMDTESGDLGGSAFEWAVEVQSNGGGYVEAFRETVGGKTMSRYPRAKTFKLKGAAPWDIRVKRLSPDSTSANDVNGFAWATYTEIQTLKLRYPNSAMVRTRVGAEQFSRIPVRSFDWLGLRIQVPSNYDPKTRVYTGVWDGTFKIAWTDNPAWIFHDMVRNNRYGLGRYFRTTDAFKWELYGIGRYCDGMVPDGNGGMEPRFRASPVLTTREQAYKVLTDLAAIFRGMAYWSNSDMTVVQDAPGDSQMVYTPANVVPVAPGKPFSYAGASASKRYSSVVVWFNSLPDQGKLVPEIVVDRVLEARIGVKPLELSPIGIWSRGQAHRIGQWALYTQQHEKEGVVFKVGLDGVLVTPGKVFQIADPNEAGERLGGRVKSASTAQVTLDADVTLASGEAYTLTVMLQDPVAPAKLIAQQRAVVTAPGTTRVLDVAIAFDSAPAPESVWLLQSDAVQATTWRCIGLTENTDNTYTITALEHAPQKFDQIELGIAFEKPSISRIKVTPSTPTELRFTETAYLSGSVARSRVMVSWRVAEAGLTYRLSWRLNKGPWTDVPSTSDNSVEVDGLTRGLMEVSLVARNSIGNASPALVGSGELAGWTTRPLVVEDLAATLVQGGVTVTWKASTEDNYLSTTIKVNGLVAFEGNASSWTWPWPALGTYEVTATHWNTSLLESLTPAATEVVVDSSVLAQWDQLGGRPKLFRVVARGGSDTQSPAGPGIYDGETGALLFGARRSYMLAKIRRIDGVIVDWHAYDVFGVGETGDPVASDLANALNTTGSDHIVVVYTYDEPRGHRLDGDLEAAMYRCGASRGVFGSPEFQYRSAYVLIGIAGCGEGNGHESYQGDVPSDPDAWCDVAFSLQKGNLLVTGTGAKPRTLRDYSYIGDLNATFGADWGTNVKNIPYDSIVSNDDSVALGFGTKNWPVGQPLPTGWFDWSNGLSAIRETSTVNTGETAIRFDANAANNVGLNRQVSLGVSPLPAGTFLSGSLSLVLLASNGGMPGILVRLVTAADASSFVDTIVPAPSTVVGEWQRIPWTARVGAGQRIYAISIYLMASWATTPLAFTGTVVFDGLVFALYDYTTDNKAVVINADGTLGGAGGGQVTITGLGYTGALDASADVVLVGRGVAIKGNSAFKPSGALAWDSDAWTRNSFAGGCLASAVPMQTNGEVMLGLNSDPLSDASYASLDYAWYFASNGVAVVYEDGQPKSDQFQYLATDVFSIGYDGYRVQYLQNDVVRRSVSAPANLVLFLDSSFATPGAGLKNIRFLPLSSVGDIGTGQVKPGAIIETYTIMDATGSAYSNAN